MSLSSRHAHEIKFIMNTVEDDGRDVFIAGNFNNWNPGDPNYLMTRIGEGEFTFTMAEVDKMQFPLIYKYVKGSWDNEETSAAGKKTKNRTLSLPRAMVKDKVARFNTNGVLDNSVFIPIIEIVSDAFPMHALDKFRRIRVLLPYNYHRTSKRYDVLYLQDGQNLWDKTAPYGTWGIDMRLQKLAIANKDDLIIVAIDHGEKERVNEFTPIQETRMGKAEGRAYLNFIVKELKPYIDYKYRTFSGREHTGIGGSSMGGLISIYAGLIFPSVFSKLMIFSPSLWVSQHVYLDAIRFHTAFAMRIYIYAGGSESKNMIPNIKKFISIIESKGYLNNDIHIRVALDPKGKHNEKVWGREFVPAVKWLFYENKN